PCGFAVGESENLYRTRKVDGEATSWRHQGPSGQQHAQEWAVPGVFWARCALLGGDFRRQFPGAKRAVVARREEILAVGGIGEGTDHAIGGIDLDGPAVAGIEKANLLVIAAGDDIRAFWRRRQGTDDRLGIVAIEVAFARVP